MMKKILGFSGLVVLLTSLLCGCNEPQKGSLKVSSSPQGAQLIVNGEVKGKTPATLSGLNAGDYVLELRAEGYEKAYKAVYLSQGENLPVTVEMTQITGLLLVETEPVGVDVMIDGISKGMTPLLLADLPLGSYELELSAGDLVAKTVKVDIEDRQPQQIKEKLESNTATLSVMSDKEGSEVRVNGVLKGTAPVVIEELAAGEVTVQVSKTGYKPFERKMTVEALKKYEFSAQMEALPSGLSISTDPAGAKVIIDNEAAGITPLNLNDLTDGPHEVTVSMPGYADQTKTIFLEPDTNESLEFSLEKDSGVLVIDTEPALVKVYLDGKLYATTEEKGDESDTSSKTMSIALKAGKKHRIQLVRDGFVSKLIEISPEVDQVVTKHEVLKRIFVYDTKITTREAVIKCRLEYKLPNGDIYFERFPGVFDTAKKADIISVQPIMLEDAENREARQLMKANEALAPTAE